MSAIADLLDSLILIQLGTGRLGVGLGETFIKELESTERAVEDELRRILDKGASRTARETARIPSLDRKLLGIRNDLRSAYKASGKKLRRDLIEMGEWQSDATVAAFSKLGSAVEAVGFASTPLTVALVREIVDFKPLHAGSFLAEWVEDLPHGTQQRIASQIRQGMLLGENLAQISKRIRTKAIDLGRTFTETAVQSSVNAVSNYAAESFYSENASLIKALRWLSTMDDRTSPQCIRRNNERYHPKTHKNLKPNGPPWGAGPGKLHPRCRSLSVPEVVINGRLVTPQMRAASGGRIPAKWSHREWLMAAPEHVQIKALGPYRNELLRGGEIGVKELFDRRFRLISVAELRRWYGGR